MLAPIPATKLNEVIEYFGVPCYKDLNAFSKIGKKKAELKRAMQALLSSDPVTGHTGLGIIYIYENQKILSLNEFRLACEKSNFGANQAMHYGNALFIYGHFDEAVEVYLKIIYQNRNDQDKFQRIVKRLSEFCFEDEVKHVLEMSYVTRIMNEETKNDIKQGVAIRMHLEKFNISLDFYRSVRQSVDKVFFYYFSLPTQVDCTTHFDLDNLTYTLELNDTLFEEDPLLIISKMNDELQELLIDVYEQHDIDFGSEQDRITVYFNLV